MLWGGHSFFPVFVLALLSTISFPITDQYYWGFLVTVPLLAATILLALRRSSVPRRTLRWATLAAILAFFGTMASETAATTPEVRPAVAISSLLMALLLLVALPAIMREALAHRHVNVNTLAAAVTGYLLIGLLFAMVYRFLGAVQTPAFFADGREELAGAFQYYSFITLTTTGYGDYVPATDAGQAVAVLEAVTGQVFLVTAVARIVSLLGQERSWSLPPRGPETGSDQSQ
jgi:voltage-gated potassium channel Kch